jgi:hypothetical protein
LQALKVPLDWIAFLRRKMQSIIGVATWDSSMIYPALSLVSNPGNGRTYRVKVGHSPSAGTAPSADATNWELWGHSWPDMVSDNNAIYAPVVGSTYIHGYVPGNLKFQSEYLTSAAGQLPTNGTVAHTFAGPFLTACKGAFFQPTGLSVDHTNGMPSILVGSLASDGCNLVLAPQASPSATGYVSSGYLFSIGY